MTETRGGTELGERGDKQVAIPLKRGAATLRDVARRAGVTAMTASRVLSENGAVSARTRAAVLSAVEELGYRPHLAARGMRTRQSRTVGVLVQNNPNMRHTHPLAYEFLLGINEGLDNAGYMMSQLRLTDVARNCGLDATAFEGHLLDGVIVVNWIPDEAAARLQEMAPPCVWLDANLWQDERCIRRDEVAAGELAVQKLIESGYRELIVVGAAADDGHFSFVERSRGVIEAAAVAGATVRQQRVERVAPQVGFEALMAQLRPEVGVVFLDIYLARAFAFFLTTQSAQPGRDFAVVCCDDDLGQPSQTWSQLARVGFDRFDMGQQAAQMMLDVLREPEVPCSSRLVRGAWKHGATIQPAPTTKNMTRA